MSQENEKNEKNEGQKRKEGGGRGEMVRKKAAKEAAGEKFRDPVMGWMICAALIVIGLLLANRIAHDEEVYFGGYYDSVFFINVFGVLAPVTIGVYALFDYIRLNRKPLLEDEKGRLWSNRKKCLMCLVVSAILMFVGPMLAADIRESVPFLSRFRLGNWILNPGSEFFWAVMNVLWFPFCIDVIFRFMKERGFTGKAVLAGSAAILWVTVAGTVALNDTLNIEKAYTAILNIAVLVMAVWKYAINDKNTAKGKIIGAVCLYAAVSVAIFLYSSVELIYDISLDHTIGAEVFCPSIWDIVKHAAFWGTSDYLSQSVDAATFFATEDAPLIRVLFLYGWVGLILLLLVLLALLYIIAVKLIGWENGRIHRNWLIFAAIGVMLSTDILFGTIYEFYRPYTVRIPFLDFVQGWNVRDAFLFTILMIGAWENRCIRKYQWIRDAEKKPIFFVPAESILGEMESLEIKDERGKDYNEEDFVFDIVKIISSKGTFDSDADWYSFPELEGAENLCVFSHRTKDHGYEYFLLSYENGKWILPEHLSEEVYEKIREKMHRYHVSMNEPDCIEELEERKEIESRQG